MNWVDQIVRSTQEAESPERFQYWSALTSISAVVKKNVWLERYIYKLYPNIYVLLVGKSGLRKGNPITLSRKLVLETKCTRIVAGRNTHQAILKELGKSISLEAGGVLKNAAGYLVSGELDSFFNKDPDAMTVFTDLYDTHAHEPEWRNNTKTSGTDVLKEPCITLLGGTNEDHFRSAIAEKDIKGGFIARTLIVFEDRRRLINDLLDPPQMIPDIPQLSCYLKEISKVTGQFKISEDAKYDVYRPWYIEISSRDHDDQTGTIERIGDTVLKVAMLISLAHNLDLVITAEQMAEAIKRCEECMHGIKFAIMGAGKDDIVKHTALVLKYLINQPNHTATKKKMLGKFWGDGIDTITLDRVMETLIQSGAVEPHTLGRDVTYVMKQAHVDAYRKFKKEIQ